MAITRLIMIAGRNPQWGLKLVDQSRKKQDACIISKLSCHNIPINYKEEKTVNLCLKEPGRHYCNQVIKVNVTCHKSHKIRYPLIRCAEKGSFAPNAKPQLTHEITSNKLRDNLQLDMRDKERVRNYHGLPVTKETGELHTTRGPRLDPGAEKGHQQ